MRDHIHEIVESWGRARPHWDMGGMAVFARIARIERLTDSRRTAVLQPHGLTPADVDVLASLWRHHPQGQQPRDLRRTMLVGSGTLTPRLDRLEAEGWLLRRPHPDDGRGRVLVLTDIGHQRVPLVVEELLAVENDVLASLPARAKERLSADLARLLQSLES